MESQDGLVEAVSGFADAVVFAVSEVPSLWQRNDEASFQLSGIFSSSHMFSERLKWISVDVYKSAFNASVMLSGPDVFHIFQLLNNPPDLLYNVDWQGLFLQVICRGGLKVLVGFIVRRSDLSIC